MRSHLRRTPRRALLVLIVPVLALAACGDGGEEPAGLDDEPTATQSAGDDPSASAPTAEPTDDPTEEPAGPTEHAFPEAGVTVVVPAPAGDAEAAALAVYVDFVREWRLSLREVRMSDQLSGLAAAPVVQTVQDSLDYQEENGIRYSGELTVTPQVEEAGTRLVVIGGCLDASGLTIVDDGEERPIDGIDTHPVMPIRVTVGNDGSGWKVNENTVIEDESC